MDTQFHFVLHADLDAFYASTTMPSFINFHGAQELTRRLCVNWVI